MPDKKVTAITNFVLGAMALRDEAKLDAVKMLEAIPTAILTDPAAISEYMQEMVVVITKKYLVNDRGTIPARTSKIILPYVNRMAVNNDQN